MKICNILEEGRYGGPQARVVLVAKSLRDFGIESEICYSAYNSDKLSQEIKKRGLNGKAMKIFPLSRRRSFLVRYAYRFFWEIACLRATLTKGDCSLVHVNGSYQIKGAMAARFAGLSVLWHLNDTNMDETIRRIFHSIAERCADGFIVAGRRVYDYYLKGTKLEERPCQEIHAPVDTSVFNPDCIKADEKIEKQPGTKILMVSNVNPTKGLEAFIDIAASFNGHEKKVDFLIGGAVYDSQKEYHEKLMRIIKEKKIENIHFLGSINNVAEALKASDIFLFTSLAEASPTAVWEAMMMAKPIVTSDVGSVNQHIKDGENGFVVPVNDVRQFVEKIAWLVEDMGLREKFGKEARRYALEHLTAEEAAKKHALFYRDIYSHNLQKL